MTASERDHNDVRQEMIRSLFGTSGRYSREEPAYCGHLDSKISLERELWRFCRLRMDEVEEASLHDHLDTCPYCLHRVTRILRAFMREDTKIRGLVTLPGAAAAAAVAPSAAAVVTPVDPSPSIPTAQELENWPVLEKEPKPQVIPAELAGVGYKASTSDISLPTLKLVLERISWPVRSEEGPVRTTEVFRPLPEESHGTLFGTPPSTELGAAAKVGETVPGSIPFQLTHEVGVTGLLGRLQIKCGIVHQVSDGEETNDLRLVCRGERDSIASLRLAVHVNERPRQPDIPLLPLGKGADVGYEYRLPRGLEVETVRLTLSRSTEEEPIAAVEIVLKKRTT